MATNDLIINIKAGTLPSGAVYNAQTYFNAIVARMTASVASGNVLWGQIGGTEPTGKLPGTDDQPGLWFGSPAGGHGYWNDWNDDAAKYLPIPMVCGQYVKGNLRLTSFVCGAVNQDRTITTPDASGTLALTSDIIQSLGTQTFSKMALITLDWNNRAPVYINLDTLAPAPAVSLTITNTGLKDGLIMDVWLENPTPVGGTAHNYTFNIAGVNWPDNLLLVEPTLSNGVVGFRVIDHIRMYRIGGNTFGQLVSKDYRIAAGTVNTAPVPVTATGADNTITITMSAVLAGGTLNVAGFAVTFGGVTQTVTAAICSGQTVTVTVATAMKSTDVVKISYSGTDMKSVNGNTVAVFTNFTVDVAGGGGGIHNDHTPGGGSPP